MVEARQVLHRELVVVVGLDANAGIGFGFGIGRQSFRPDIGMISGLGFP